MLCPHVQAVVPVIRLRGVDSNQRFVLTGSVLADIFLGNITNVSSPPFRADLTAAVVRMRVATLSV